MPRNLRAYQARVPLGGRAQEAGLTAAMIITAAGGKPPAGLSIQEMQSLLTASSRKMFSVAGHANIDVQ